MQQLCPHPGIRAAFTGVAYNLGNAVSSIAPTIETALGERFPTPDGTPNYAKTQMILVGIVSSAWLLQFSCQADVVGVAGDRAASSVSVIDAD